MTAQKEWFVRADDGKVYGPADMESLVAWAQEGRVEPTSSVSCDRIAWTPAYRMPELEMKWLVEAEPGKVFGPFNRKVVISLFKGGAVSSHAKAYRLHEFAVDQDPPQEDRILEREVVKEVRVEVPVEKVVVKEVPVEVPVEKIVEKEVVKEVRVEVPVEKVVVKEVPVEKIVEKVVVKEVPVEIPVEKEVIKEVRVEVPVEKVVEKVVVREVPVEKVVEKEVVKEVRVEVPVEKVVVKEVPVEKVVEKVVVKEVRVEVPVEKVVERVVATPSPVRPEPVVPEVVEVADDRTAAKSPGPIFNNVNRGRLAALEAAARRELASSGGKRFNFTGGLFGRK